VGPNQAIKWGHVELTNSKVPAEEAERYRALMDNARRLRRLVSELEALAINEMDHQSRKPST
jgi:hypothetical protein